MIKKFLVKISIDLIYWFPNHDYIFHWNLQKFAISNHIGNYLTYYVCNDCGCPTTWDILYIWKTHQYQWQSWIFSKLNTCSATDLTSSLATLHLEDSSSANEAARLVFLCKILSSTSWALDFCFKLLTWSEGEEKKNEMVISERQLYSLQF